MTTTAKSSARVAAKSKKNLLVTLRLQLETGLPVMKSLTQQAELSPDRACQAACAAMGQSIASGSTLAQAALACPGLFNEYEASVIADGEQTGQLPKALEIIEEDLEWRLALRGKVISALIYPVIVFNVAYLAFNIQLVLLGQLFTYVAGWFLCNVALITVWVLATRGRDVSSIRGAVDTVLLTLPPLKWAVGNAILLHQKALFFGSLSRAFGSGSSAASSVIRAADQLGSPPVRRAFGVPAGRLTAGSGLAEAFHEADYMSPHELAMIASGETSGQLESVFDTMARTCREDFENWLHVFSRIFPLGIYFVVVAYVVTKIL